MSESMFTAVTALGAVVRDTIKAFTIPATHPGAATFGANEYDIARAILASDWLAEVRRTAAKETAERIAEAIEADHSLPWNGMHHEALSVAARIAREEGRA